ncbi:hypothetical protein N7519_003414 [Penicillium mononematosum]|uniref:uncharacterized protein n=1 Tax=Penicillium mononematosum TaxID=268346 RepID=UPI002547DACB|nr:uncharacterized protein N7519_003414 [Penicillium mononematosum]KAJ6188506.1 hypothetical protein N7519_003414 [Penicillium mononematosum]
MSMPVTSADLLQRPLSDISVGPNCTQSDAIHDIKYVGPLRRWATFEPGCADQLQPGQRCVHKQRKDVGKTDTTVYGISSDAMNLAFTKLDNESRPFKLVGVVGNGFEQVLSLLVYLMKKAASMSPASSKRTSRRTQQGSGESDLTFDHNPRIDDKIDVK